MRVEHGPNLAIKNMDNRLASDVLERLHSVRSDFPEALIRATLQLGDALDERAVGDTKKQDVVGRYVTEQCDLAGAPWTRV